MPKSLFFELETEKRNRVMNAALNEFAQYGFSQSSTNTIVRAAGISKGSLFKYFENKEDLYFYILDDVISNLMAGIEGGIADLPADLFERAIKYSELEFDWYIQHPRRYKLIKSAFEDDNSEIFHKTQEKYQLAGAEYYYELFEDISADAFNGDRDKIVDLLKWFLEGFNKDFIKDIRANEDLGNIKQRYQSRLKEYAGILRQGFYKQ